MTDEQDLDKMLLEAIMAVVPDAGALNGLTEIIKEMKDFGHLVDMLKGYGTLINILQAASEQGEGTMTARLATGYYELTNRDPGAKTDEIRLRDPDDN